METYLTIGGERRRLFEWVEMYYLEKGITKHVVIDRLKRGWPVERAVLTPLRRYKVKGVGDVSPA